MNEVERFNDTLDKNTTLKTMDSEIVIDCCVCHKKQQHIAEEQHNTGHPTTNVSNHPFYLTSCSHVLCPAHARHCTKILHSKCPYCSATNIEIIQINRTTMSQDIYKVFENVDDQLGNLYGIMQFQSNIVRERMKHLEELNMELSQKCERQRELLIQARNELAVCKGLKQKVESLQEELKARNRNGIQESKVRQKPTLQDPLLKTKPVKQYEYNKANHTFNRVNVLPLNSSKENSFINAELGKSYAVAESTTIAGIEYMVGDNNDVLNEKKTNNNGGKPNVLERLGIKLTSRDVIIRNIKNGDHSAGQYDKRRDLLFMSKNSHLMNSGENGSNKNNTNSGFGIFQHMKSSNTNTSHSGILSPDSSYGITKPNYGERTINANLGH